MNLNFGYSNNPISTKPVKLTCWNCYKKIDSTKLTNMPREGYLMLVCNECKKELKELRKDQ